MSSRVDLVDEGSYDQRVPPRSSARSIGGPAITIPFYGISYSRVRKILRVLKPAQDDMVDESTSRLVSSLIPTVALILAAAFLLSGSPDEKRISVYSNAANYSLTVIQRNNLDYVGLLELLEPLGTVSAHTNSDRWEFRYNDVQSEFSGGKTRARVRGNDFDLPASFLLENGRGLVPISSLSTLLPRILGGPITFNQGARRLFVGNVAVHFTAQIDKTGAQKLVMNFSSPVNPTIATEPGKLRMVFTHEPIVGPGSPTLTFDSKTIPSATFQESNGAAEIAVTSSVPVMASFSNDGRTITIGPPVTPSVQNPAPAQTQPAATTAPAAIQASTAAPAPQHVFAVIDASHGGDERGAALSTQLSEKDVTLAFARALRTEMMARGLSTLLLRDADTTLSLDQRAGMTNSSGAVIYLCIHASSEGNGVRLYTALVPSGSDNQGPFLDWDTAQSSFLGTSQLAETGVASELKSKQIPVRTFRAPLRPLNNIVTAALAIEISPTTGNVAQLTASDYEQSVASAVATGVLEIRDKLQAVQR
jgi:N-acetylmuramoyl-L-alanine amidase